MAVTLGSSDARARAHTTAPILCAGRMRSNTARAMGARAWAARSLVVAALASLCVAGVAADVEPRDDASALGESESRLVDLRYELSVRLPKGVLPCELTPDEGAMHAVEKAVFDAINHDVAPLPRNADVRLACVCEGERCDERCAEDFVAPEEHVAELAIEATLGAAHASVKAAEKKPARTASNARTALLSAARARVARSRSSAASGARHLVVGPAYSAERRHSIATTTSSPRPAARASTPCTRSAR